MKKSKLALSFLKYLHQNKDVRQSNIIRHSGYWNIAETNALNATVRAVSSRTIDQLLKEELITEPSKNRYRLAERGVVMLLVKPKPQKLVPMWTFKRKGVRRHTKES